jgi:hypothetical protein
METLADLAEYIAARGIEITPCRVRPVPACAVCDRSPHQEDTYQIVTAEGVLMLCGTCAARIATIAVGRLPHVR